jgi:hypothetical protein
VTAGQTRPSTITTFENRGWAQVLYLAIGAAVFVQGLATGTYFLLADHQAEGFAYVMLGLAFALTLIGLWFCSQALRRLRDPEPPIVIGPRGIHDRAISLRPIPWTEIRNLAVHRGSRSGPHIGFDLDEIAADVAEVRPRVRAAARVNRLFGFSYRVHHMGTTANVDRLIAAIAPYASVKR